MHLHLLHSSGLVRQQALKRTSRLSTSARFPSTKPVRCSWTSSTDNGTYTSSDDESAASNSLFSPAFVSVLQQALDRQGSDALLRGSTPEEPRKKAEVEMLEVSVNHCVDRLQMLERMRNACDSAMQLEIKQLERLRFCLNKVESSAAYLSTVQKILDEKEQAENDRYYEQLRSRVCDRVDWEDDGTHISNGRTEDSTVSGSSSYSNITASGNVNWWEQNTQVASVWESEGNTAGSGARNTAESSWDVPANGHTVDFHNGQRDHGKKNSDLNGWSGKALEQSWRLEEPEVETKESDSFFGSSFSNEFFGGR